MKNRILKSNYFTGDSAQKNLLEWANKNSEDIEIIGCQNETKTNQYESYYTITVFYWDYAEMKEVSK